MKKMAYKNASCRIHFLKAKVKLSKNNLTKVEFGVTAGKHPF
jgi:hypothetical protein